MAFARGCPHPPGGGGGQGESGTASGGGDGSTSLDWQKNAYTCIWPEVRERHIAAVEADQSKAVFLLLKRNRLVQLLLLLL